MGMVFKLLFSFYGRISVGWWWSGIFLCICLTLPFQLLLYSAPTPVIASLFFVELWIVLSLLTKRLHDLNKSASWILMVLIPVLGQLWLLVEAGFLRGKSTINLYGKKNSFMHKKSAYGYSSFSGANEPADPKKPHTPDICQ